MKKLNKSGDIKTNSLTAYAASGCTYCFCNCNCLVKVAATEATTISLRGSNVGEMEIVSINPIGN